MIQEEGLEFDRRFTPVVIKTTVPFRQTWLVIVIRGSVRWIFGQVSSIHLLLGPVAGLDFTSSFFLRSVTLSGPFLCHHPGGRRMSQAVTVIRPTTAIISSNSFVMALCVSQVPLERYKYSGGSLDASTC